MKDKTLFNEQYKYLRTNVKFAGDGIKSIVVTSGYFGEGKTSVAANLAKSFALSNHKVVIVDMDLRRPSLRNFYDIDTEIGVTNVVVNKMDFNLAISHDESIWDLDIIHAGAIPPNANELVSSDSMKNFIRILEKCHRIQIKNPSHGITKNSFRFFQSNRHCTWKIFS